MKNAFEATAFYKSRMGWICQIIRRDRRYIKQSAEL